ncbi:MAG TPA: FAD binding domain-containing protein [Acidimicrobiales bacterium]|nr:FAD binding domain-containing protein [Acidimicrobiales bacterium]
MALPVTLEEAVEALVQHPGAHLLAGGTDFCVEVNFGLRRPPAVVGLRRVGELRGWRAGDDEVVLGAGITYTEMTGPMAEVLPGLAAAARTVGSPQIRNAGTLGGNIATASPAGDALPLLAALDARVTLQGPDGSRVVPLTDLITGVKRTSIRPGEIVVSASVARVRGPQQFLKVGTRNAMVIAIASAAVVLDLDRRRVRCALGSVAPVPLRARRAEEMISEEIDWSSLSVGESALRRFGDLAADECSPITDHRSTAGYRRHAVGVIASRGLRRCLRDAA